MIEHAGDLLLGQLDGEAFVHEAPRLRSHLRVGHERLCNTKRRTNGQSAWARQGVRFVVKKAIEGR